MEYLINGPWGRYVDNFLFTKESLHQDFSPYSHFYMLLHLGAVADLALFGLIIFMAKRAVDNQHKSLYYIFTTLFVLSFLLTIPLSQPLAYLLPGLTALLFPWRWMAIMEFSLAILSVYMFFCREGSAVTRVNIRNGAFLLIYMILSAVIIATTTMLPDEDIKRFEGPAQIKYKMTPGVENIPKWAHNWLDLREGLPPDPVSFAVGNVAYSVRLWEPQKRIVQYASSMPSRVRISTFYYPGWELSLDGMKVVTDIEEISGAIVADIPAGMHIIKLQFVDTPVRRFAQWLSVFFLFLLFVLSILFHRRAF